MFRQDFYGIKGAPPLSPASGALTALDALWHHVQPALALRLAQEHFDTGQRYDDADWWLRDTRQDAWAAWYTQTHSLWLVWRGLCGGGRAPPQWPASAFVTLPELQDEAAQLFYQWACLRSGTPRYPSAEQVAQALQQWLRRFELLRDVELDITLHPSLADGHQLGQACMARHWPTLQQAVSQRQWLPLRVIPATDAVPHPSRSLALLLITRKAEQLCCYEPLSCRTFSLWREGERFLLNAEGADCALHSFYPLAAPINALRPSLWRRFWHRFSWR